MPKERLHLLLADLTLQSMETLTGSSPSSPRWKEVFLHGAIAPDLLFYDLPTFRFSAAGGRLHALMEPSQSGYFPDRMAEFLATSTGVRNRPWLLGMAHHFMVDQRWHPLINGYAELGGTPCRRLGLSQRDCHHWLESELESFWLDRLGPPEGYIPYLRGLRRNVILRESVAVAYGDLLIALGTGAAPSAEDISRCSHRQVQLMLEFARPSWMRLKRFLLALKPTKYVGALIVPRRPSVETGISNRPTGIHRLWETEFVDQTVHSIANRFLSLPGWSWLSPKHQCPQGDRGPTACPTTRNS